MSLAYIGSVTAAAMIMISVFGCASSERASATPQNIVERGRYLADSVAMCTDCHTPRDESGRHIPEKWLQGASLDFTPVHPMPMWSNDAPPIAGLVVYSGEHIATLLTTGLRPDGTPARPPHPAYSMSREDAQAIVAYLASLGTGE